MKSIRRHISGLAGHKNLPVVLIGIVMMMLVLLVVHPARAAEIEHRLEDGLRLMSLSQTILAGEFAEEMEYTNRSGLRLASSIPQVKAVEAQLLEAMINSIKYQLATLIKECNQTRRSLMESNETCAVATLDSVCEEGKREFRSTLSLLRKIRGDKRKFFTRLGERIKRAGKQIWHAVGPVGRRILRSLGNEVVDTVKTPGGFKIKMLRVLVRSRLKTLARSEIKNAIKRGAERLITRKWEVARGPSGDQCYDGEETSESPSEQDQECSGDLAWIDEGWPEVEAAMKAAGKYCMDRGEYRLCLRDKTLEGLCPEDALEVCQPLYDAIPPQRAGNLIEIEDNEAFYYDADNKLKLSFPLDGGEVEGNMEVEYEHSPFSGWSCEVKWTYKFSGTYDPETCVLEGAGTYTLSYKEGKEGDCLGYSEPGTETRNWAMRISYGNLDTCGGDPDGLICEGYDLWESE